MKVKAIRRGFYLRAREIGEFFECPAEHVCLERDHGLAGWMVPGPAEDLSQVPPPEWRQKHFPNLKMPH